MIRRLFPLALALLVGAGACRDGELQPPAEEQSVVVIQLNIQGAVPELRQIKVNAHLGSAGMDAELFFPPGLNPTPIQSGATLALLIPTTRMGLLDLIVYGLAENQTAVERRQRHGHRHDHPASLRGAL